MNYLHKNVELGYKHSSYLRMVACWILDKTCCQYSTILNIEINIRDIRSLVRTEKRLGVFTKQFDGVCKTLIRGTTGGTHSFHHRADLRVALSQWETSLPSNVVSHWLGANLESALTELNIWLLSCINDNNLEQCQCVLSDTNMSVGLETCDRVSLIHPRNIQMISVMGPVRGLD